MSWSSPPNPNTTPLIIASTSPNGKPSPSTGPALHHSPLPFPAPARLYSSWLPNFGTISEVARALARSQHKFLFVLLQNSYLLFSFKIWDAFIPSRDGFVHRIFLALLLLPFFFLYDDARIEHARQRSFHFFQNSHLTTTLILRLLFLISHLTHTLVYTCIYT